MNSEDVKRFSVYTQIFPNKRQYFYLESWDGSRWEPVTYQGNRLNYDSLDTIAQRIIQICPMDNTYTRIVFPEKPLDSRDDKLEGICLDDSQPYLMDSLTRDEKLRLLNRVQRYASAVLKRKCPKK